MKKIILYTLILITLVGLFGPAKAQAEEVLTAKGFCSFVPYPKGSTPSVDFPKPEDIANITQVKCYDKNTAHWEAVWDPQGDTDTEHNYTLACSIWNMDGITGCIAGVSYVVWQISSLVAWLGGRFLDFFVYYSTNSSSYNNTFVSQGWGAVRDIANIFFIITLLYVAIKTVLSLDVSGGKKLISYVIIIALIINFSLFTTKVVIDASNILAKIFYNNLASVGPDGGIKAGGEKSISIGLINKFNPQQIVSRTDYNAGNQGTFIFITLLLTAITLLTAYIFFAVALLFVARVVSLWIAMIFAPLAFISYAVPFDVPFGHKEWWSELLKNAFLAPIFIFFLYIIVLFTDFLKEIPAYSTNPDMFEKLMTTIIPFAILMVLLMKAKKLAVEYSGKMGQALMTAGKVVGGLALGAATGGAALAGRTVVGGGGGYLAGKLAGGAEKIGLGRTANKLKDIGSFAQKSSFDMRGIKVAGQSLGSVTDMKVGEAQKGGWSEMKKQQVEKRQKRAEELKEMGTGKEKGAVTDAEIALRQATIPEQLKLEQVNKKIDQARIDLNDAKNAGNAIETGEAKKALDDAKREKAKIRGAEYKDASGAVVPKAAGGLADLESAVHTAKQAFDEKSEKIIETYAKKIEGKTSKNLNTIFRLGTYSRAGASEAAQKIRNGTKLDSGEKPH